MRPKASPCSAPRLSWPSSSSSLGGRICDLVLEILPTHPEDRAVFKAGVACIKNPHADKWMEVGVAEVMVAGLQRFAADQEVCRVGAFAVWGLAYGSAASSRLLEAGVCEPMVKMIETFAGDTVLVRRGCGAMQAVSCESEGAARMFGEAGACSAVLSVLRNHPDSEPIQGMACCVVAELTKDGVNRAELLKQGAGFCYLMVWWWCGPGRGVGVCVCSVIQAGVEM